MFTETLSSQQTLTEQDRTFDNTVLNSIKLIQSQCIIAQKKKTNAKLFSNLMTNNFPVPARKMSKSVEMTESTSCSTNEHSDIEDDMITQPAMHNFQRRSSDPTQALRRVYSDDIRPIRLTCVGPKSAQLLFCMNLFQMQMKSKWNFTMEQEFLRLSQIMLDYFSAHVESLKNQHAESIAASICLLVGSKIGISKKDFLDSMKPMKKNMVTKVDKIKKSTCYIQLKKAFKNVIAAN